MLDANQRHFIYNRAYVAEHIPEYVESVAKAEPFLHGPYLCYVQRRQGIFIGYPLVTHTSMSEAVYDFQDRFKLDEVIVVAKDVEGIPGVHVVSELADHYYELALPVRCIDKENAYMARRALREVSICEGSFSREHESMVRRFCDERSLTKPQRAVYLHISDYMKASPGARLIEARRLGKLVAYNILEEGSLTHLFYMFHIRDRENTVPGASDLLFLHMIKRAEYLCKKAINLGLGITGGVKRFKEKWGGKPFLRHSVGTLSNSRRAIWKSLLDSLLRVGGA